MVQFRRHADVRVLIQQLVDSPDHFIGRLPQLPRRVRQRQIQRSRDTTLETDVRGNVLARHPTAPGIGSHRMPTHPNGEAIVMLHECVALVNVSVVLTPLTCPATDATANPPRAGPVLYRLVKEPRPAAWAGPAPDTTLTIRILFASALFFHHTRLSRLSKSNLPRPSHKLPNFCGERLCL